MIDDLGRAEYEMDFCLTKCGVRTFLSFIGRKQIFNRNISIGTRFLIRRAQSQIRPKTLVLWGCAFQFWIGAKTCESRAIKFFV